jgi:hypothetical protein
MALQGGHRFPVTMDDAFPHGLYALGVEQAEDYDEKTKRRTPSKDKQTGELVWAVLCIDRDPEARRKDVKIKVSAAHMPVLPDEVVPGAGVRAVEFSGLTATAYVDEGRAGGRARLAFSFRATGVHAPGKTPTAVQRPGSGDGKAA